VSLARRRLQGLRGEDLVLPTYKVRGYRPLRLLSNVLSAAEVSAEQFWGLSASAEGEVLTKGIYNWRWEIETTDRELKVEQKLEGDRSHRTLFQDKVDAIGASRQGSDKSLLDHALGWDARPENDPTGCLTAGPAIRHTGCNVTAAIRKNIKER
jgi:hypothetical protein